MKKKSKAKTLTEKQITGIRGRHVCLDEQYAQLNFLESSPFCFPQVQPPELTIHPAPLAAPGGHVSEWQQSGPTTTGLPLPAWPSWSLIWHSAGWGHWGPCLNLCQVPTSTLLLFGLSPKIRERGKSPKMCHSEARRGKARDNRLLFPSPEVSGLNGPTVRSLSLCFWPGSVSQSGESGSSLREALYFISDFLSGYVRLIFTVTQACIGYSSPS